MYIVFDIGGTNMRIARADEHALGEIQKVPTPQDPKEAIRTFVRIAKELAGGERILAVAGSIRWMVVDGIFLPGDKRLPQWGGLRFVEELERELGARVVPTHDTAVTGLGEVHSGAGKGSSICAYVTVSTGVGGDRIVDGKIDRALYNPEIGRQLINGGQLEDLVSGAAVEKKFGFPSKNLDSIEERNKLADTLASGLFNTCIHWTPDTVVLGGSMIVGVNPIPLERVQERLTALLSMYPTQPRVLMAALGDDGGLEGARILATQVK